MYKESQDRDSTVQSRSLDAAKCHAVETMNRERLCPICRKK
jgi:hypothetical protein